MTSTVDIVVLLPKLAALAALLMCGLYLLVQAKRARRPATVVNGRVVAKGLNRAAPINVLLPPPRLNPGAELGKLADVIKTARVKLDAIGTCQQSAARHLDSAEVALNRLLAEIGHIMPPAIAPTVLPRRSMAMAA